jgi:ubiquinone/menaquinone biosynthesis C-methylase UbiE
VTERPGSEAARKVWGASPAGSSSAPGLDPTSSDFFVQASTYRFDVEQPWLRQVIPFASTSGHSVLEIGCGVGFDACEFARNGARYTGIDITRENIQRTRASLERQGLSGRVVEADAASLPFDDASFEFAYSNGVLHHVADTSVACREVHRVLKSDGTFWMIVYHRNSVFYRLTLFAYQHLLKLGFRKQPFSDRVAGIEFTTSRERPIVNVYSRRDVARLLADAGFHVRRVRVRKLIADDVPGGRFLRWIPQSVFDVFARRWGWYVIAEAVKQ